MIGLVASVVEQLSARRVGRSDDLTRALELLVAEPHDEVVNCVERIAYAVEAPEQHRTAHQGLGILRTVEVVLRSVSNLIEKLEHLHRQFDVVRRGTRVVGRGHETFEANNHQRGSTYRNAAGRCLVKFPETHEDGAGGGERHSKVLTPDETPACSHKSMRECRDGFWIGRSVGELEADARRVTVLGLVAALRPIVEQISRLTSQISGAVREHPDGQIFLAFFKDPKSVVTAAGLLAEIGYNRARYTSADALAADGGMAPVAIESGKRRTAVFRWACDKRLRNHIATLADSTRHWHPWAHDVYTRARQRGCDHPHAIRILGRAWTRVLWRCWQDHTPYDRAKHRALTRQLDAKG